MSVETPSDSSSFYFLRLKHLSVKKNLLYYILKNIEQSFIVVQLSDLLKWVGENKDVTKEQKHPQRGKC